MAKPRYDYYRLGVYEGDTLVSVSLATSSLEDSVAFHTAMRKELGAGQRVALLLCEVDPNPDYTLRSCIREDDQ